MKKVKVDADRLRSREEVCAYANDLLQLPWTITNLDALYDALSEVDEETELIFTRRSLMEVCRDEYAYDVLVLLGDAAKHNPYLKITFQALTSNDV